MNRDFNQRRREWFLPIRRAQHRRIVHVNKKLCLILVAAFGVISVACMTQSITGHCDLTPWESAGTIAVSAFVLGSLGFLWYRFSRAIDPAQPRNVRRLKR